MKKIKNLLVLLLFLVSTVSFTACAKNDRTKYRKESFKCYKY